MILADGYPEKTTAMDASLFEKARSKNLRVYVEYPSFMPGLETGAPRGTHWERAVISSEAFARAVQKYRILAIHDCRSVTMKTENPDIVIARVPGFDSAVYGLPDETFTILSEIPVSDGKGGLMVSATKLSQANMWACYLRAYQQTGFYLFLKRAKKAISMTMAAYPDKWIWTNGIQQERAKMLLPLAWLIRVDDTPEHRAWLLKIAGDLLESQDEYGAIREEIGEEGKGGFPPPASNEAYGTSETPLIQTNNDSAADLLYTIEFALHGLHEAAAANGEKLYKDAEDKLTEFLCRIQIRSEKHPELNGGWFRAFDFNRWEYWASNGDAGWGHGPLKADGRKAGSRQY